MPTVSEIVAELKALNIKGYSGKKKSALLAMLEKAKGSVTSPAAGGSSAHEPPAHAVVKKVYNLTPSMKKVVEHFLQRVSDGDVHESKFGFVHPRKEVEKDLEYVSRQVSYNPKQYGTLSNEQIADVIKYLNQLVSSMKSSADEKGASMYILNKDIEHAYSFKESVPKKQEGGLSLSKLMNGLQIG